MNYPHNISRTLRHFSRMAVLGLAAATGFLSLSPKVSAQTTNAYDVAADPAYAGAGEPNGLSSGVRNGGFGFGDWAFTVLNSGGAFINGSGPSGASFNLWNTSANSSTIAVRPFGSPLVVGQSFSVQLRLNSLDNTGTTNALLLQDAGGNTIFAYWHVGFEPNGAVDGHYTDASVTNGVAVGFSYGYQQFQTFTFTLNGPTTYTFTDNSTGHSFSGSISGTIAQAAFFRGSLGSTGGGQDFQFDVLKIVSSAPPTFSAQTPAPGSYSASRTNLSLQVTDGSLSINTNTILLKLDGNTVTPTSITKTLNITTISYVPASPLSAATSHTVQVSLADSNNNLFTNLWSYTTGFPSLPARLPGPIATGGGQDLTIFSAAGDAWVGANYNASSSRTLYVRHSMVFLDLNGEASNDGSGGCYGGLHFFQDGTERLLVGETWRRNTWSVDTKAGGDGGEVSLQPETTVLAGEWHTMVTKVEFSPAGNAAIKVWLDPDFSLREDQQDPGHLLQISMNNTFNNIRLRCGNNTANAQWTNIIVGELAADVGFPPPVDPIFQGFVPSENASSASLKTPLQVEVVPGSVGIRTNDITLSLDGNSVTPAFTITTNSIITVAYQPASPFSAGSAHFVTVNLADTNGTPFTRSWSFTVDSLPSLPVTLAGPIDVSGGGLGITIYSNLNGWISDNYQSSSTNTLFARFSMVFYDLGGEVANDGSGGCFGGLHFYQDNDERLLAGQTWRRNTWSVDTKTGGDGGEVSLPPETTILAGEWHTFVVKCVYSTNGNAAVQVWLDPDFTRTEGAQLQTPLAFSMDNRFNNIHLRCGNNSSFAEFTNVVIAATALDVGFAQQPPVALLSAQAAGGNLNLSWTSTGVLEEAPAVTGPWTNSANQTSPQVLATTNSAIFYRLRQ